MTTQPSVTHTHTWTGTHLPAWTIDHHHWNGDQPIIHTPDGDTPLQPGWCIALWSDGTVTVGSPTTAQRVYGPDGIRGQLERARAELAQYAEAESADAAAGSYAGRVEELETALNRVRQLADQWDHALAVDKPYARTLRAILSEQPAGTRHVHVTIRHPDPGAADRAALSLAEFLRDQFPAHHVTTDAREWEQPGPAATQATEPVVDRQTAVVLAALHRSAEADVSRVISLYERWVKAGPPPLGTSMSRWWDKRLVELHAALNPKEN